MKIVAIALFGMMMSAATANAQYRGYSYPGRGYYSGGGHYSERYGERYAPRVYAPRHRPDYGPRGGYDWSWGGGSRAYTGGRPYWGGEW